MQRLSNHKMYLVLAQTFFKAPRMSPNGDAEETEVFHYNNWISLCILIASALVLAVSLVSLIYTLQSELWFAPLSLLLFWTAYALLQTFLARATIEISEQRISARLLGLVTKSVSWRDVKKVVKTRLPKGYGLYADRYEFIEGGDRTLFNFLPNTLGKIRFGDEIGNLNDLLRRVSKIAQRESIPIYFWNLEKGSRATTLGRDHDQNVRPDERSKVRIFEL